ncbi:MAG: HEAT repeat domain-containing protein, partial [Thermodesulfobacteriota bacterium]
EELDESLLLARDLMSTFVKTIKAFRLYPPENPSLNDFRNQLFRKFQLFLNKFHSFIFQIGEYYFSFKGKIIYENTDLNTSLAFRLYKDGLRELRFMEGLEESEIQGLVDILKRVDKIDQMEDDLVTLMWEGAFVHISYLATDEFLDEMPGIIPKSVEEFRQHLKFEPLAHKAALDFGEEGEQDGFDLEAILSEKTGEPPSTAVQQSVYFLTPDELERLRKETEAETAPTAVFNIIDILLEIMALEKEPEPFQDAVDVLQKMLAALLELGEFQKASDLLTRVYIILNTYQLADWQVKITQQFIEVAGEPPQIERIGKILEKEKGVKLEEVSKYLTLLRPNSIRALINLLGELSNSKARRVLCDVICEIGKNGIEIISSFINDHRWYLVRNIIYILARVGKEQALPYVQKGCNHGEARVRREAVQALGTIGGSKAFGLLVKALDDTDVRIRSMAALNLAKVGKKASLPHLLGVVQSKEFPKKEKAEIKAFFDAIGMSGCDEAVRPLQKLLEQRGWFDRKKKVEIRKGAANALALIGTPEAKSILKSGKNSKNHNVRQACLQAAERLAL